MVACKVVLVTGCSSGLGKFTADYLKRIGFRIIVTARKEKDAENLRKEGFECLILDLNSSDSIKKAVDNLFNISDGKLDGIINNAGIEIFGAIEDLSRDDIRNCFETNVFGTIELTSQFIPHFRKQHLGKIIFISASNSNGFGYPFLGPGNATKCAIEIFASTLKRELRNTGINVSTVCPGELPTNLLANMLEHAKQTISLEQSTHAKTYNRLMDKFSSHAIETNNNALIAVASSIEKILKSNNPPRRIVTPFSAKIHYLSHSILPEWVQDFLLFYKMRKGFGIDI
jgi:NAD(P)-dependent dehydrogenase (short-subunit alcohol dehydrogenase family)